jgi:DNA-binding CsgD family transcriptional regulator
VLEVDRQRRPRRRTHPRPLGLTEREIEVLRLIAHGCSNHQIAERFEISRRTAGQPVQQIYPSRATASGVVASVSVAEAETPAPDEQQKRHAIDRVNAGAYAQHWQTSARQGQGSNVVAPRHARNAAPSRGRRKCPYSTI